MATAGTKSGGAATGDEPADDVLLERYTARREEAAFAALVRRHGPMVLGVCRRVLQHEQDAEDAFQAVFCVLARKAGAIRQGTAVGGWLYAVACRIARKAKTLQVRRRMRESELPDVPAPDNPPGWEWRELWPILDEEVNRLPERYRRVFALCYLEGKTNHEAAAELRCPPGTVFSRLMRARERLRARLICRGIALSAGALAVALGNQTSAAVVRTGLAEAATRAALRYAIGQPVGGEVAALADAFSRALARARRAVALGVAAAVATIVCVVLLIWFRSGVAGPGDMAAPAATAPSPQADRERLRGVWRAVSVRHEGKEFKGGGPIEWAIEGDRIVAQFGDVVIRYAYQLDPNQTPKALDVTPLPGQGYPPTTLHWAYELDSDTLKVCSPFGGRAGRPKMVASTPGSNTGLIIFRRQPADQRKQPGD
jgi:RNA polymerase sigma factor (sigma-70 family)